jgi:hypothetical protein
MSTPTPDENQPMRDALQHDAAGVSKPDFNPALHYATMRRLRGLVETPSRRIRLLPALASAAAVLTLAVSLALWQMHSLPKNRLASKYGPPHHTPVAPSMVSPASVTRTSLITYQAAAERSDDALFALLDTDARELLPKSPSVFSTPPH